MAGLLLVAGMLTYGPHIVEGGFVVDDWAHASVVARPSTSVRDVLAIFWEGTSYRPVLVGYVPATFSVFGTETWAHHTWSLVLAIWASASLYAVLRRVSFPPLHAALVALLTLLFPWSDSIRLWATASHVSLSIALALTGILLALRGLDVGARSRRAGRAYHCVACVFYGLSVLTYEATAAALLLTGALYLTRAGWTTVRVRWTADVAVVLAALAWNITHADRWGRPTLAEMLEHAKLNADSGATLLAHAAFPFSSVGLPVALWCVVAVCVVAGAVRVLGPDERDLRSTLSRWLRVAAAGLLIVVVSWALFVPTSAYYHPGQPGIGNRVNAVAAIGVVLVVYAAAVLATTLLARLLPYRRNLAIAMSSCLAAICAIGYADRTRMDQQSWARAARAADGVIAAVKEAVPNPVRGSTIYTFGHPGSERQGIPIFARADLVGAVRLAYDDQFLIGLPVLEGTAIDCHRTGLTPVGEVWTKQHGARYGKAYFVDVPSSTGQRIDSRETCAAALSQFGPGPVVRLP